MNMVGSASAACILRKELPLFKVTVLAGGEKAVLNQRTVDMMGVLLRSIRGEMVISWHKSTNERD
ncbi:MAG: hypothetical protein U1F42_06160 [Candidatus Competibacteraceae bacterium]